MLIAVAFAAALAAAPLRMPPMVVNVTAASDISPTLVKIILAETDAVWRGTGIAFMWQQVRATAESPYGRFSLRVLIGNDPGKPSPDRQRHLGWIVFDDATTPEQEIYLSYANAYALLVESRGVVGLIQTMPLLQRETLLGRAMGRALAHEIGHYLSASKAHAEKGLMAAVHSASQLFGPDRGRFKLAPAEQQRMVARLTSIYMASRG